MGKAEQKKRRIIYRHGILYPSECRVLLIGNAGKNFSAKVSFGTFGSDVAYRRT